jgi:uncharacterized OB-fold protein
MAHRRSGGARDWFYERPARRITLGELSEEMGSAEAPAAAYRRHLQNGKLGYQRCGACSAAVFYPRVLCPVCGGDALEWRESAGSGTVYATTAVYSRDRDPRSVVLVDLDEGFRMMSRVEGVRAEDVEVGTRVRFEVRQEGEDGPVAVFVLEDS